MQFCSGSKSVHGYTDTFDCLSQDLDFSCFFFLVRHPGGSDTLRLFLCSSSPARLPIQGPSPPFASTRAPLALPPSREPSHFLLPLPALPSSPPASSHMTGKAPPRDVTDVRAPAPGLPPHPARMGRPAEGRTWSARAAFPNQSLPERRGSRRRAGRAGSRMCGARGSPAPAAGPRAPPPPPRALQRSALPSLSTLPLFRALRLRVSASHCSESVTAPARARGCSPRVSWPSSPLLPLLSSSLPLLPLAAAPPALSGSESRP